MSSESPDDSTFIGENSSPGSADDDKQFLSRSLELRQRQRPRKKRWSTKVKTGCVTCRRRRVKCDEGKPACNKCLRGGHFCEGYIGSPEQRQGIRQLTVSVCPNQVDSSTVEMELFHYFRTEVASQLAGVFDQDFWKIYLVQGIQSQPILWYACNAVAAAHRRHRGGGPDFEGSLVPRDKTLHMQSLRQYHSALHHLMKMTQKPIISLTDRQDIVAANTLFMVLAWLRGDLTEYFAHYINGIKLIGQWKLWEQMRMHRPYDKDNIHPADSLLMMYIRADSMTMNMRRPLHRDHTSWPGCRLPLRDEPFISFTEAYFELEVVWNGGIDTTISTTALPPEADLSKPEIRVSLLARLNKWKTKFKPLAEAAQKTQDVIAATILEARVVIVDMIFDVELAPPEKRWDDYEASFEKIITLSLKVLKLQGVSLDNFTAMAKTGWQGRTLTMNPQLSEPVYFVARRCRNPILRRKALSILMRDFHQQPGVDTVLYIYMAQAIIKIEEETWYSGQLRNGVARCGCIRDKAICNGHRVAKTAVNYPSEGRAEFLAATTSDLSSKRAWRRVPIIYGSYKGEATCLD